MEFTNFVSYRFGKSGWNYNPKKLRRRLDVNWIERMFLKRGSDREYGVRMCAFSLKKKDQIGRRCACGSREEG